MNKFTKLLSVFVIAGAVSCGVAGLAGCGGGEEAHTHNGTYHEAVAATCTQEGNIAYYTCDGADCAGKYFEDEACTKEITNIVVPATGHTEVYTDNGDGTHKVTCEHGDLTESNVAHADEDHDGKCDDCEAEVAGTYVAEVPATCTAEGTAAHYIKGDGSDGKYYSDVNCTTEVTEESLVIAKTPHAYEYTPDATNAQHSYACEDCDDAGKVDCVDENNDGKCDVCGADVSFLKATAIPAGSYYNSTYGYELVVAEDGTVSFIYYGYECSNVSLTAFAVNEITGLPTATLTYTYGSESQKTVQITRAGIVLGGVEMPLMPKVIVEDSDAFEGVYAGELVLSDDGNGNVVKVTEFAITNNGYVVYTQVTTTNDGTTSLTQLLDGKYSDVVYNDFTIGDRHFVAVEVNDNGMVTKIELTDGTKTATFTYKDGYKGTGFEIPTLPVEDYTLYKDTTDTNSLVVTYYSEQANYTIKFNGDDLFVLSGNATDGYLVLVDEYDDTTYTITKKNYVLKFSENSVVVSGVDGTEVATLALSATEYPTLVTDGETVNKDAVVDPFNSNYAYYKVNAAGYYTITAGSNALTIYTQVEDHYTTNWGDTVYDIAAGKSKTIQLTAGQYIAVYADYKGYEFTATYSENEPVVEVTYTDITSPYTISNFTYGEKYYLQYTVPTTGTYTITSVGTNNAHGAAFTVDGDTTVYGDRFVGISWSTTAFSKQLTEGDVLKMTFYMGFSVDFGDLTITIAKEESGSEGGEEEATFEGFTAAQQGTYNYVNSAGVTFDITLGENAVHYKANTKEYDLTFVSLTAGTYKFECTDGYIEFTLGTDALTVSGCTLSFSSFINGQTATKASSEEEATFEGFTADQQGTYNYVNSAGVTFDITLSENAVHYKANTKEYDLTFVSLTAGTYKFECTDGYIEFTLSTDGLTVSGCTLSFSSFIINKTATKVSSEEETTEGIPEADQGIYTYESYRTGDSIVLTVGETTIVYEYVNTYGTDDPVSYTLTFASVDEDGVYVFECEDGSIEFTIGDGVLEVTSNDMPLAAVGSANWFEANIMLLLNAGENTVTTSYFGNVYTFIAPADGTYEFAFDSDEIYVGCYYDYSEYNATFTLELTKGEVVELNCMTSTAAAGDYTLTITKG